MAKRGRKPDPAKRKAYVSLRLDPILKQRLVDAQQANAKTTLTEEIEARLRLSFNWDKNIEKEFGGPENFWLLQTIAREIGVIEDLVKGAFDPRADRRASDRDREDKKPLRWWEDRYVFGEVKRLIDNVLDHFKPSGRMIVPPHCRRAKGRLALGRQRAIIALANIEAAPTSAVNNAWPRAAEFHAAARSLVDMMRKSALKTLSREWRKSR
jgi:hypothetical protein